MTPRDYLRLQQLRLLAWADERAETSPGPSTAARLADSGDDPSNWTLTGGHDLQQWQQAAVKAWFQAGRRGTIKVVTGAGKTICALAIAERLQRDTDSDLRVVVLVPTIVLMNQWRDALLAHSNLPSPWIARLGGGFEGTLSAPTRILIAVLASARKALPGMVEGSDIGPHLLLIADESHRAGAPEMSQALKTLRAFSLGLSATPEREDDDEEDEPAAALGDRGYNDSLLGREIGPIVYEMTFAQAVKEGILPPFEVRHYGIALNGDEASRYAALSRSIQDARETLRDEFSGRRSSRRGSFHAWCRRLASRGDSDLSPLAARFVAESNRRKTLLYSAKNRSAAVLGLLARTFEERPGVRCILFHESIAEVVGLFHQLIKADFPAVMEHSDLPDELRTQSLELFRRGVAQVVVSAKSLIEGFNVPEADVGIIVASSSSPRQRIQSIGRMLRKHRSTDGLEKSAEIHVLYVRDTVDEVIYEKKDWSEFAGVQSNQYFRWDPPAEPIPQEGPPRLAIPDESEIDDRMLQPGDDYPGRYEGAEYTCDHQGNVRDAGGRHAQNPQGIPEQVVEIKGQAGRFRITPAKRLVLIRALDNGEWRTLYVQRMAEQFCFGVGGCPSESPSLVGMSPGDCYPGAQEPSEQLFFRQKRGGVIAKRVQGGEAFARGEVAERLLAQLRDLAAKHGPISKFNVNKERHAFWLDHGKARFIAALDHDLEFPQEVSRP